MRALVFTLLLTACARPHPAPAPASPTRADILARTADLRLAADWAGASAAIDAALAASDLPVDTRVILLVERATIARERGIYQQRDHRPAARVALADAARLAPDAGPAAQAAFAEEQGWDLYFRAFDGDGRFDDAMPHFLAAQRHHDATRDVRGQARAWFEIGLVHQQHDRTEPARDAFSRGLALARAHDLPIEQGYLERHLGSLAGSPAASLPYYERSLALREGAGHRWGAVFAAVLLAETVAATGDHARARGLLERAAALAGELEVHLGNAVAHEGLAALPGDPCPHLRAARRAWHTHGTPAAATAVDAKLAAAACGP